MKAIWNRHITDNNLSFAEAALLAQNKPQEIAKVVTDLADFDPETLRYSFRAVRNMYNTNTPPRSRSPKRKSDYSDTNTKSSNLFGSTSRQPVSAPSTNLFGSSFHANGPNRNSGCNEQASHNSNGGFSGNGFNSNFPGGNGDMFNGNNPYSNPTKRSRSVANPPSPIDSVLDVPDLSDSLANTQLGSSYETHEFKDYQQLISSSTDLVKNLVTNPDDYERQLKNASTGDLDQKIFFKDLQSQSKAAMDVIEKNVNEEDLAYAYHLAVKREQAAILRAKLAAVEAEERSLVQQQLQTTGKAKAHCYIGRKALKNIDEALRFADIEDIVKVEEVMKKWMGDISEEQNYLRNAEDDSIELILKRMKADGANGKSD